MNADEHDQLWELLGRAKQPAVPPFFARNVLREIRCAQRERSGFFGWFMRTWRVAIPVGAASVAVMLTAALWQHSAAEKHNPLAAQIVSNPDYDVINHLDELAATEENAVWLDNSVD